MNNRTEAKLTDLSGMQKAIEEILKQAWERGRKYGQNEDRPQGKMRLIDADELKKTLKEAHINMKLTFDIATFNCVMNIIDNAPTADDWQKYSDALWKNAYERGKQDARPQGEWNYIQAGMCICPFCGATPHKQYKNFCPKCGAKMQKSE